MEKEIHVLILDDEEYVMKLIEREFRDEPFGYIATTNPDEAATVLSEKNIKVIICDQRMPKITGIEFLQVVKEKFPDVIRILFSGYQDIEVTEAAINIGQIYRYVNKPWDPGTLRPVVVQSIEYYDLMMENRNLFSSLQTKNKQLKVLNSGLENMVEFQKEFISIVSHELRTPLASIKSTLDLVLTQVPGKLNDDQNNFLMKSKDNVSTLNRLVDEMLDLKKLDSEQIELEKTSCDLKELINSVIENYINAARKKGLTLVSNISDGLPILFIDAEKIRRVMNNLINNAIKFTDQGGITAICEDCRDKGFVKVCIEDTGRGIREEDRQKIFQKFQQAGEAQVNAWGTGLGLSICQEIIDLHGGKIWVESEYGKGSQFYFTLLAQERSTA